MWEGRRAPVDTGHRRAPEIPPASAGTMKTSMGRPWSAWVWAVAAPLGCASGASNDDGPPVISSFSGGGSGPGDDETTSDVDSGADDKPEDDTSDDGPLPGSTGSDTTSDDGPMTSSDSGGVPGDCDDGSTCASAAVVGGIAGDEPSQLSTSGDTDTWVTLQVSENNSDVIGEQLTFTASLTSPAGSDFDLFVFRGNQGSATGCGGQQDNSTNAVGIDSVFMSWGEGALANNADDSAWVAIEIRSKNGMCVQGAEWTLTVIGDT